MNNCEERASFAGQIIYILKPMWKRIALVLGLSFIASGLSLLSVGVMAPYISLIEKPDTAFRDNPLFKHFIQAFSLTTTKEILIAVSVSLMAIFIIKNVAFFIVKYVISYTNLQIVRKLKYRLFRAYMYAPFSFHQSRNTMQLINTATTDIGGFSQNIISNILELIVDSLVFSLTLAMLIWITPQLVVVAIILLAAIFFFHRFSRSKTFKYGKIGTETNALSLKIMNQGLQGIVPAKIYGVENFFISRNDEAIKENVHSSAKYFTFILFPRIGFETLIFVGFIGFVLLSLISGKQSSEIFAIAGTLGVASLTIIPSISRITNAFSAMKNGQAQTENVYKHIREIEKMMVPEKIHKKPNHRIEAHSTIEIAEVSFTYPERDVPALHSLSMTINSGQSVGLIGKTGSGKSTLVSLLLGLYVPEKGAIRINGINIHDDIRAWQSSIGYVPQSIYLLDDTLRNNIAFGIEPELVDETALCVAVSSAALDDVVKQLPNGLDTMIGENGIRLSGGQRQRIGIARALYNNPSVLIFDEATSALDTETEEVVSKSISILGKQKTIILVAHRLSTLKDCDIVYKFEKGKIIKFGTYEEVITNN